MTVKIDGEHQHKLNTIFKWYNEKEPEFFNIKFVKDLQRILNRYGSLTMRQEQAIDNIIARWRVK